MVRNKKPLMAIYIQMIAMREDLIRPVHGVASDWSLLLHSVQRGVPGQIGTAPLHAGDEKNGEGGSQTTALPGTENLGGWSRSSAISTKVS